AFALAGRHFGRWLVFVRRSRLGADQGGEYQARDTCRYEEPRAHGSPPSMPIKGRFTPTQSSRTNVTMQPSGLSAKRSDRSRKRRGSDVFQTLHKLKSAGQELGESELVRLRLEKMRRRNRPKYR